MIPFDFVNAPSAEPVDMDFGSPAKRGAKVGVFAISHTYDRRNGPVLSDINLVVPRGEVLALIGRSGSGKSTLLHIMAGLTRATDGAVQINGTLVEKPSPRWVMMFQAPSLFPWMTVAQNAGLGLKFAGKLSREAKAKRVAEALSLVDLAEFADRNVQDLSGGQQQRVALARSLAPDPDLLLLDEPFSALDAFTRQSLQADVRRIAKQLGITVILVTHDVSEAVIMADRGVFLASGPGTIRADERVALADAERLTDSRATKSETLRFTQIYSKIATQHTRIGDAG